MLTVSELNVVRCLLVIAGHPDVRSLVEQKLGVEEGYMGGRDLFAAMGSLNKKIIRVIEEAMRREGADLHG